MSRNAVPDAVRNRLAAFPCDPASLRAIDDSRGYPMTRLAPARPKQLLAAGLAALCLAVTPAGSARAVDIGFEGSLAEDIVATSLDAMIVRPLASARLLVGSVLFVPSLLFSLPMGREGFDGAYDTMIAEPYEYAFEREMGEFN